MNNYIIRRSLAHSLMDIRTNDKIVVVKTFTSTTVNPFFIIGYNLVLKPKGTLLRFQLRIKQHRPYLLYFSPFILSQNSMLLK